MRSSNFNTRRLLRSLARRVSRFHSDEIGASYIAASIFVVPLYIITIAAIVECVALSYAKMGVTYAAYAAGRSAIVWIPTDGSKEQVYQRVHLAAAQALTPYSSSNPLHVEATGRANLVGEQADLRYFEAYHRYVGGKAPLSLFAHKRQYALGATKVTWRRVGPVPRDPELRPTRPLEVTVTYEKPISTPLMGLVFGRQAPFPGARFYSREITSTVVLHLEGPKSTTRTLGINYDPWSL